MKSNLWLEFETHRDGKLVRRHEEEGHSWTKLASEHFFYSTLFGTSTQSIYNATDGQKDRGILIGTGSAPFNDEDTALAEGLTNVSTLDYRVLTQSLVYNSAQARWELKLSREFYCHSAHLGGVNHTVAEVGLVVPFSSNMWIFGLKLLARDVLTVHQLVEPLDVFTVHYNIYVANTVDGGV